MYIVSIDVGRRRRLDGRSFQGDTGTFKDSVAGAVRIGELGRVEPGEAFTVRESTDPAMTTIDLFRGMPRKLSMAELRQFLALPIDARTRDRFEDKLRQLEA